MYVYLLFEGTGTSANDLSNLDFTLQNATNNGSEEKELTVTLEYPGDSER